MTADKAFLQAIQENPDDDTLRLVYADWLEERGDPRGEFIRVQCQLAATADDDPRTADLKARELALLIEHEAEWVRPLGAGVMRWAFRRGFVERVAVTPQVYLDHADDLPRVAPIRHIEVDLTEAEIAPVTIEMIPESVAREDRLIPLGQRNDKLIVAMQDPGDGTTLEKLHFILNRRIEAVKAPTDQIVEAINRHYGEATGEAAEICCTFEIHENPITFGPSDDDSSPIAKLVNLMFQEAFNLRATEIEIKPQEDRIVIQYRIDDQLTERDAPPKRILTPLVARIKHLAGIQNGEPGCIRGFNAGVAFYLGVVIRPTQNGPRVLITLSLRSDM